MHHQYTSRTMLEGAWLSDDSPPLVRCRWWWEGSEACLCVMCGNRVLAWSPPRAGRYERYPLIDEFPSIAYDISQRC